MTTTTHYVRTENGTATLVPAKDAIAEGHAAEIDRFGPREFVMILGRAPQGSFDITYKDERHVTMRPASSADIEAMTAPTEPAEQPTPAAETFEPADFDDFAEGDRIHFVTADNGYGGSGGQVWRTGTVTRATPKTLTIACDGNAFGDRAVLRRATFSYRAPQKAVTPPPPAAEDQKATAQSSEHADCRHDVFDCFERYVIDVRTVKVGPGDDYADHFAVHRAGSTEHRGDAVAEWVQPMPDGEGYLFDKVLRENGWEMPDGMEYIAGPGLYRGTARRIAA